MHISSLYSKEHFDYKIFISVVTGINRGIFIYISSKRGNTNEKDWILVISSKIRVHVPI